MTLKIIDSSQKKVKNKKLDEFIKTEGKKLDKLIVARHENGEVQYWISYYTEKETKKIIKN